MTILPPVYYICATCNCASSADRATRVASYVGIVTDRQYGIFRHPPVP